MPISPPNAWCTRKPSGPGSKYRRSRCWNGRHDSGSSWPGRCTLRYFVTTRPSRVDEDRGVVPVTVGGELRVAEMEARRRARRASSKSGLVVGARHLALEERDELGVGEIPAREERRERELGEHDELRASPRPRRAASSIRRSTTAARVSARATGPICAAATVSGRAHRRTGQAQEHVQQHVGARLEIGVGGVLGGVVADARARWARTPCPAGHTRASICAS